MMRAVAREAEARAERPEEAEVRLAAAAAEEAPAAVVEARAGQPAAVAEEAQRASGEPRAAAKPEPGVTSSWGQWRVEECRNIRRICFPGEMTCGTSGT